MEPFASTIDYREVYDTEIDDTKLGRFLLKATLKMRSALDAGGVNWEEPTEELAAALVEVCCDMVHRSIDADGSSMVPYGASQFSQTAGSYNMQFTLANPYGDLFLTKAEKELLGISRSRIGFARVGAENV